ncbi:MAG TPA: substrate-binding domain-containing protein [Nitrospiraceae bacterium]|nr:substrate-binding domain-containing protein [Nitrospiraceae bacterium]
MVMRLKSFVRWRPLGTVTTSSRLLLVVLIVTLGAHQSGAEQGGPFASVAVDADLAHYAPQEQVAGGLRIQGSETMYPLLTRLGMEFQRRQPKVNVSVKGGGSSKAIEEFLQPLPIKAGMITLKEERSTHFPFIATSRELFDAEIKEFVTQHGHEPVAVPVAVDAVALYVHKDNPLTGLTLDQVDAIYSTTRNRGYKMEIKQWGQLGLSGRWERAPIQLYGRDLKSATRAFFLEHCLAGGDFTPGVHETPGAASVILEIGRNQMSIGYSGLGLQSSMVRVVPLAESEGMPFIAPTSSTMKDQTYPLRRVLYLYFDKAPESPLPPAAKEFLSFIMSQEGQEAVTKAGFFPLPVNQVKKSLVTLSMRSMPAQTISQ